MTTERDAGDLMPRHWYSRELWWIGRGIGRFGGGGGTHIVEAEKFTRLSFHLRRALVIVPNMLQGFYPGPSEFVLRDCGMIPRNIVDDVPLIDGGFAEVGVGPEC